MGLKLKLAPQEEIVINGSIVRNDGPSRISIEVRNRSDVLRASEMFDADSADTPIKRLCFFIQIAMVSREHREEYKAKCFDMVEELKTVLGSSKNEIFESVRGLLEKDEFYAADKTLRGLFDFEAFLLKVAANAQKGQAA